MTDKYILDGHTPVPVQDLDAWARWFANNLNARHVAKDEINGVRISTVFLSFNHQFGDGPPLLFETMIFGGNHDELQTRCSTWNEAKAMHKRAVALVKGDQ